MPPGAGPGTDVMDDTAGAADVRAGRMRKGKAMNKAVTDGIEFMPPAFADGLDVWSREDGRPGTATYDTALNAAFVPADQDFGGALEIQKAETVQRLRYMGETPVLPGCYLRVAARVKAMSGSLPTVRIAAFAGGTGGAALPGVATSGPETQLTTYGEVVEISAIVGTGLRGGVDMVWGAAAQFGHFGLDLTGPSGGVIRIDDIRIDDVSSFFLRDIVATVDVRDYGALGDGITDDSAAFAAADAAAQGRTVLIPEGNYFLGESVTLDARARFEGTVTMPPDRILALRANFDLPAYINAFGDEEEAFRKAYQALLNNAGHESLDMGGRKIGLRGPLDMAAAVANRTVFNQRHVIRNGQFSVFPTPDWETDVVTSQGTYDPDEAKRLSNVSNVANIPAGALVEGNGVGREVYVTATNPATGTLTLSEALFDAAGTQVFTFRRFKYILDFSGFQQISRMVITDVEFQCSGICSTVLLPPAGTANHFRDCFITRPKDRGITSHGAGDQGMMIDRCLFTSDESALLASDRVSIGFNANSNDLKVRDNRVMHFRHFAVMAGSSSIIAGNHVFQGDNGPVGPRLPGFVMTRTNNRATITGNYICDCSVEWSNEHDAAPEFGSEFSFSAFSITDNIFLSQSTAPWFTFITVRPHGPGHFIDGLIVTGNTFRLIDGPIDRVEGIDTTFADLDFSRFRNITFRDNAFNNVQIQAQSPLVLRHDQVTPAQVWTVAPAPKLPFGAWAQTVESAIPEGPIARADGSAQFGTPYYLPRQGPERDQITLHWPEPVSGSVRVTVRIDNPI